MNNDVSTPFGCGISWARMNPAELAGILFGDQLIAVDGNPITPEMTVAEVAEMIRGEKGTAVTLTVIHPEET